MGLIFFSLLFELFSNPLGLPCSISIWKFLPCLIFYFVMFICYLLELYYFLMRDKKLSGSGEAKLMGKFLLSRKRRSCNQEKNVFEIKGKK